jgi:hypothetical protein
MQYFVGCWLVDGHPISNLYPTNQRPAGAAILNLI